MRKCDNIRNKNLRKGRCIWCHFYKSGWYDLFQENEITKFDRGVNMDILHSPNIACAMVDAQLLD